MKNGDLVVGCKTWPVDSPSMVSTLVKKEGEMFTWERDGILHLPIKYRKSRNWDLNSWPVEFPETKIVKDILDKYL